MKKNNLIKVIVFTIIIAMALTFVFPGSSVGYTGEVTRGDVQAVGFFAALSNINIALSYFGTTAIYIVAISLFYSVIGKTNSYNLFVENVVKKFQGKETLLINISIVIFGVLAAVVSDPLVLLLFVPFMYAVMSKLNIDKKAILASTIIAALLGAMCGIYDSTIARVFSLKLNTLILVKVILLVITLFVLTIFIAPSKNKKEVTLKEEVKKPETKKVSTKKTASKSTPTKKAPAKKTATKKAPAKKASTNGRKKVSK